MKKIGILTFHRSYNYGAFMQCYALCATIRKDFPDCDVEVIDYCTERMYENYPTKLLPFVIGPKEKKNSVAQMGKNLLKCIINPCLLKQKRKLYKSFQDSITELPLSKFHIISNNYLDLFKRIDEEYDVLVVGSDCVWEYKTYPFPNAYFPNYNFKHTKLLSYAATSDRMHKNDLTKFSRYYIKETLERFDYIGVRDVATENFISSITSNVKLFHNCDPTILLNLEDIPQTMIRVKRELVDHGIDLNKPIIGLMCNEPCCKMIKKMFGNRYQIVSVYESVRSADYNFNYLTPFEWAKIFSLFSVTVTSFFHGSLLSLINGTPTIVTDYWSKVASDHLTKIEDFYRRIDLEDHYFYMPEVGYDSIKLKEKIEYFINYPDSDRIKEKLEKEKSSYQSFRCALENIVL